MFFKRKSNDNLVSYDREKLEPVIRASICNGEQVAGFRDRQTGEFHEETLIAGEADLEAFKRKYGLQEVKKIY